MADHAQPKPSPAAAEEALSFEQILERLEQVVDTLEQALTAFERGVSLARLGARRLDEAERRVEVLLRDEDGVRTRPLDKDLIDDE